jgi:uncharacterized CHY-type Zn-finger protein
MQVYGNTIDTQTRCVHYGGPTDVVAIKFVCCERYYPCFQCHLEGVDHEPRQWPRSRWAEKAVLCGVCEREMTIMVYRAVDRCPGCSALFNDGCRLHAHLYFERDS